MKSKLFFLFIVSVFVLSSFYASAGKYERGERLLGQAIRKTASKFNKKYGISLSAVGGGTDEEGIWLVDLMFDRAGDSYTMEEGRAVIVSCLEEMLFDLNHNEKLRPYLKEYPLTPDNVSLVIISYEKDGSSMVHPGIDTFAVCCGKLRFKSSDPKIRFGRILDHRETLEEAKNILKNGSQKERKSVK